MTKSPRLCSQTEIMGGGYHPGLLNDIQNVAKKLRMGYKTNPDTIIVRH
jgi:hypothetical protein